VDWRSSIPHNALAMKNFFVIFLLVACALTPALCQQLQDPATKADVDKLLELTGARQRVLQVWQSMAQQAAISAARSYKKKHPNATPQELERVSQAVAQGMQESFQALSIDELMNAIVPVYERHLTHADVQSIIAFYDSPAGQKLLQETPAMMAESAQAVQPIIQKHQPELDAAAEKMLEKSIKGASTSAGNQKGNTPQ
jgi:hypothetical protein